VLRRIANQVLKDNILELTFDEKYRYKRLFDTISGKLKRLKHVLERSEGMAVNPDTA